MIETINNLFFKLGLGSIDPIRAYAIALLVAVLTLKWIFEKGYILLARFKYQHILLAIFLLVGSLFFI